MEFCKKCGGKLASDSGCEACWLENARRMSDEINAAEVEFFVQLRRAYARDLQEAYFEWADAIYGIFGTYPTFEEYQKLYINERYRASTEKRRGR